MGVITFNGVTSSSLGVEVETFPDYVAPQKDYEVIHIPGRNGDIIIDSGTYQNVSLNYKISVATYNRTSFTTKMNNVVEWLHSSSGYARLEDSYNSDFYRMAYFPGDVNIENLFDEAGRAEITFVAKPQRYYKSGETGITYTTSGTINNQTNHIALPILNIVTNNTESTIHVGSYAFTIEAGSGTNITVDCELQNAYYNGENKNNFIVLNGEELPKIEPGTQNISFSGGVQSVEVIPRWWTV